MSSKIIGLSGDHFAKMCVGAIKSVKTVTETGAIKYPVKAVGVTGSMGGSVKDTQLVNGFCIP